MCIWIWNRCKNIMHQTCSIRFRWIVFYTLRSKWEFFKLIIGCYSMVFLFFFNGYKIIVDFQTKVWLNEAVHLMLIKMLATILGILPYAQNPDAIEEMPIIPLVCIVIVIQKSIAKIFRIQTVCSENAQAYTHTKNGAVSLWRKVCHSINFFNAHKYGLKIWFYFRWNDHSWLHCVLERRRLWKMQKWSRRLQIMHGNYM